MKRTMESVAYRSLLEEAVPMLTDYSIGFALPTVDNQSTDPRLDAGLGGSGTLVKIDDVYGILTANHVIDLLDKSRFVGLILPSRVRVDIHHPTLPMKYCDRVTFAPQGKQSHRPDLGLLIPPSDTVSMLKSKKTFYDLSQRQKRILEKPQPINNGFWMLSGFAGERTSDLPPEQGFLKVKLFRGLHGAGLVTKEKRRDQTNFDYLINNVLYNDVYEGPESYGGFSGGGLWQMLVKPDGGKLKIADWLLSGVAFFESEKKNNDGQATRKITCHGRISLYQVLIDGVRARSRSNAT